MVSSPLFPEVHMLVCIYEVQLHYKIKYFDNDIRILYISLNFFLNFLSFVVTYISSRLIGYYFRMFGIFYFISTFILILDSISAIFLYLKFILR